MPKALPPHLRQQILTDIKTGQLSRAAIARKNGVGPSVVGKIATQEGINPAWDRTQTKNATEAKTLDNKAKRVALAAALIDDAERFRQRAWSKYKTYERGAEGLEQVEHELPPAREQQALMTALGIATQRHLELENFDRPESSVAATSLLDAVAAGVEAAYRAQQPAEPVVPEE